MNKYLIWCEGNQFGEDEQIIECLSLKEANDAAYELAYDHLQQYSGMYGIPEDSEEELEDDSYESFEEAVSDIMNYGARLYDGHLKYNVSEEGLEPKD